MRSIFYKIFILFLFLFLSGSSFTSAQQVVASAGSYYRNASINVNITVGEAVIESYSNNKNILTQGFNQYIEVIVSIDELPSSVLDITAYPNPASDNVILDVSQPEGLSYLLFDSNGRLLEENIIEDNKTTISFQKFPPGMYILKAMKAETQLKTFKLIQK